MSENKVALELEVLSDELSVCRLNADAGLPSWALASHSGLCSATWTADELSIVCPAAAVPPGIRSEGPFRTLKVRGPLDFALTGIMARLTRPLADAGIPVFVLSTFDTDYVLVREQMLDRAVQTLIDAGLVVLR